MGGELNPKIQSSDWKTVSGLNPANLGGNSAWFLGKNAPNCEAKEPQRSGLCYCIQPWVIGGAGQSCAKSCQDLGQTCESNHPTTTKSQLKDRLKQAGELNPKIQSSDWKTVSGLNPANLGGNSEWFLGKNAPNCEAKEPQRSGLCYCIHQPWVIGGAGQSCAKSCQDLGRTCQSNHPTTTKSQLKDRLKQAGELNPKITS